MLVDGGFDQRQTEGKEQAGDDGAEESFAIDEERGEAEDSDVENTQLVGAEGESE
jgi:hypothetical protein